MKRKIVELLLVVGSLAGCAQVSPKTPSPATASDAEVDGPLLGQPCALSSGSRADLPPRIFVELATLEGDLTFLRGQQSDSQEPGSAPLTFSQALAEQRWKRVSVRHVIANDGERQSFSWEFEPPTAGTECLASEDWVLHMTPHAEGESVRIEVEVLPAPPPDVAPNAWHVPKDCRASTTLVVGDQQLVVLGGFPLSPSQSSGTLTTVTPYLIREHADLQRLAECKKQQRQPSVPQAR